MTTSDGLVLQGYRWKPRCENHVAMVFFVCASLLFAPTAKFGLVTLALPSSVVLVTHKVLVAVFQQHPFRTPGGTGGIDEVREIAGQCVRREVGGGLGRDAVVEIELSDFRRARRR